MSRIRRRIHGGSHIPDDLSASHGHSLLEAACVMVEVGIVVAVDTLPVKLVNRQAAGLTEKEFLDDAVVDCHDWRSARRHDIGCLMQLTAGPALSECVLDI